MLRPLDLEMPADLRGFLSGSRTKFASESFEPFSLLSLETDVSPETDDCVFFPTRDVQISEPAPKRTLRSSRSTDANASKTPVVDDAVQLSTKKVRRER